MEPTPEEAQEAEPQARPQRSSGAIAFLVFLAVGGSAIGVMIYQNLQSKPKAAYDKSGFDIAKVDAPPPPAPVQAAPAPPQPVAAPQPVRAAAPAPAPAAKPLSGRAAREAEWVGKYANALRRYQANLTRITDAAYKKYPVVRNVDADFGKLDRYMELKHRFEQDRNPFNFARQAIALPEVRQTIRKYLADPEAWTASANIISQTMKQSPPPPEVYGAAKDFFVNDPTMPKYMDGFIQDVMANSPAMIQGITPDTDTSAFAGIARDVAPGAPLPLPTSPPKR